MTESDERRLFPSDPGPLIPGKLGAALGLLAVPLVVAVIALGFFWNIQNSNAQEQRALAESHHEVEEAFEEVIEDDGPESQNGYLYWYYVETYMGQRAFPEAVELCEQHNKEFGEHDPGHRLPCDELRREAVGAVAASILNLP